MTWTRRHVLRGLFGGAVVSVPLPIFPSLQARAEEGVFPTRFGIWNWGNGMVPSHWTPDTTGAGWTPSPLLEPLARHVDALSVLTGYEVKVPNVHPHDSGKLGFLCGIDPNREGLEDPVAYGPTVDQLVAREIGGQTRFRSLECGANTDRVISWNGPNSGNPTEADPVAFFQRVFGTGFVEPGTDAPPDPTLGLRQSVLDVVTGHAQDLQSSLGSEDRVRLEQHLDGIREIERQIAQLQLPKPPLAACVPPEAPTSNPAAFKERARLMADLLVMALACDQSRVFTYVFSVHNNDWIYDGLHEGHHRLTHDEQGDQPWVREITTQIMTEFAYFLDALRAVEEGDGTLLDHCAVLGTSDVSLGRLHALDEFPALVAGTANGALKTNLHLRTDTSETAAKIPLTLMRAVGARAASFGEDDCYTTDSIGGLEA